jgi:hypothetical protein
MGTLIPQTKYDVLAPGTYGVRLSAVAVEDGIYGTQVVMRFDVLDEGFAGLSIKAWAAPQPGCRNGNFLRGAPRRGASRA